jgi:hypothetical protein
MFWLAQDVTSPAACLTYALRKADVGCAVCKAVAHVPQRPAQVGRDKGEQGRLDGVERTLNAEGMPHPKATSTRLYSPELHDALAEALALARQVGSPLQLALALACRALGAKPDSTISR